MLDYKNLAAVSAIIEEQSFDKAAQKLHVTQSAISQRLRQLEEHLGQRLVIRSNPIQATPAGQQVIKHFQQICLLQDELRKTLSPQLESGFTRVSIGVNADSLETWLLDALAPLLSRHQILLDIKIDDQDQTQQLLRNGSVSGCITSSATPIQGCNCIPLGVMPYRCLASPDYIAQYFPGGVSAKMLHQAPIAEFNHKDELQNRYLDQFFNIKPGNYPRHRIPSSVAFFDLIVRGHTCGMVPDQQSHAMLAAGKVVDLTPGQYLAVPLYWHVWNLKSALTTQLTDALTHAAQNSLDRFEEHPLLTPASVGND
ncbi:MAG: LysR family transcriptional regulator ArgP [Pontibacterium sp.]